MTPVHPGTEGVNVYSIHWLEVEHGPVGRGKGSPRNGHAPLP